jgi:hypothetical protein
MMKMLETFITEKRLKLAEAEVMKALEAFITKKRLRLAEVLVK